MSYLNYISEKAENIKTIFCYSGKFQPFHRGHFYSYNQALDEFNCPLYIITSNKHDDEDHPFSFVEKRAIISTMFNSIDSNSIINIKRPYSAEEICFKLDLDINKTIIVFGLGIKDSDRFEDQEYYKPYKSSIQLHTADKNSYLYDLPQLNLKLNDEVIKGSKIRELWRDQTDRENILLFKKIYGSFDDDIFQLFNRKLKGA